MMKYPKQLCKCQNFYVGNKKIDNSLRVRQHMRRILLFCRWLKCQPRLQNKKWNFMYIAFSLWWKFVWNMPAISRRHKILVCNSGRQWFRIPRWPCKLGYMWFYMPYPNFTKFYQSLLIIEQNWFTKRFYRISKQG